MTSTLTVVIPEVSIGDVFYRSWGYDQTNVNFYEVVGLTASGKSMRLREIRKYVEGRGVLPAQGHFKDNETYTKRIQMSYDGKSPCAAWNTYSSLSKHNGKPQFDTTALGYSGH
jgi:hypothetical protein